MNKRYCFSMTSTYKYYKRKKPFYYFLFTNFMVIKVLDNTVNFTYLLFFHVLQFWTGIAIATTTKYLEISFFVQLTANAVSGTIKIVRSMYSGIIFAYDARVETWFTRECLILFYFSTGFWLEVFHSLEN